MSHLAKVVLPTIVLFAIYLYFISRPSGELGSFDAVRAAGEINQNINVKIVKDKDFTRDARNNIISFIAMDKDGQEAFINLKESIPETITQAEVVELFGHMHQNTFIASAVTIIR